MKHSLIIGLALFLCHSLAAQVLQQQAQVTTFSSRSKSPVEVDVSRTNEDLTFNARNNSRYPYELVLEFNVLQNLSPTTTKYTINLHSGNNRLFKLRIQDPEASPDYAYSIQYKIANSRRDTDLTFPYLIPLKPKVKVESHSFLGTDGVNYLTTNSFKGSVGDSVYAVRRGIVVNTPLDIENDRIGKGTLEVIHLDGTVALYTGLDPTSVPLKSGQQIYPGQPIGTISNLNYVMINVYLIYESTLSAIPLYFTTRGQEKEQYSALRGVIVDHPADIIQKELSDKEKKKHTKGTLYSSKN